MDSFKSNSRVRSIMNLLLGGLFAVVIMFGMLYASAFQVKAANEEAEGTYTVYFENNRTSWKKVYCYIWKGNSSTRTQRSLELVDADKRLYKLIVDPSEGYTRIQFTGMVGDFSGSYDLPGQDATFRMGTISEDKNNSAGRIIDFVNTLGWDEVYVYVYNGVPSDTHGISEWPGVKIDLYDEENGIYRYDYNNAGGRYFIFNNGAGEQVGTRSYTDSYVKIIPGLPEVWEIEKKEDPISLRIVDEWGNLYCEDQDGNRYYGLQTVDGDLYYFGEEGDGMMKHGLYYVDGLPYWFGEDGKAAKSQFVTPYYDTYYFEADGKAHTGWLELDGEKYYADEQGTILKGVQTVDGKSYLFDRNDGGKMVRNKMAHDWWGDHYYGDDGVMQTGFITYEGNTFYFFENGDMAHGWQTIDGNTYFFGDNDGIMAKGTTFIYWRDYEFDENGVLQGDI